MVVPQFDLASIPKTRFLVIFAAILIIAGGAYLFTRGGNDGPPPITLKMWGTDPKSAWDGVFSAYSAARPNVEIEYSEMAKEDFSDDIIKAFATGNGPDLFMIGNHDLLEYRDYLATSTIALAQFDSLFPRAAKQDLVYGNEVYAYPLYMDTLSLFYNKDHFDQAGMAAPPKTWTEFVDAAGRLTKFNAQRQITQSGAALGGTGSSVRHAGDIVSLLMLQSGVTMTDDRSRPQFGKADKAAEALQFYAAFGRIGSSRYSWSGAEGDSFESFIGGKTSMAFGYKEDADSFEARSPFLNFGIAPMPQTAEDAAVNYPAYDGIGVWKRSRAKAAAWDFAFFAATDGNAVRSYLSATGRPPALRTLISDTQKHPTFGFLANQALSARSWQMGNYVSMNEIWDEAIRGVMSGESESSESVRRAEARARDLLEQ